jgi:hypothetical protein
VRVRAFVSAAAFAVTAWLAACGGKLAGTADLDGGPPSVGKRGDGGPGNPGYPYDGGPGYPGYPGYDAGYPYPGFDSGPPSMGCPGPVDPSQIFPWKAPASNTQGSCSENDLATLSKVINDPNASFQSVYDSLKGSPSCQSCVFSSQSDANWQPIVWSPDQASGNAFVNYGACFAVAPGGTFACGKGIEDDELCFEAACPYDTCTDQNGCATQADQGVCAQYSKEATVGCGSAINSLDSACGDFVNELRIVCGNGTD